MISQSYYMYNTVGQTWKSCEVFLELKLLLNFISNSLWEVVPEFPYYFQLCLSYMTHSEIGSTFGSESI